MKAKLAILCLCAACAVTAQEFKRTATSGFTFLELPVMARHAALGETSIALPDMRAGAVFANPAGAGRLVETHSFSFSYAPWFGDTRHLGTSYAYSSALGVLVASAVILDYGTMDRYVREAGAREFQPVGTFRASAHAIGLTYARSLTNQFSFGVTLKYVNETIDVYSAQNVVFDGGVLYDTGFRSIRIAATIQNFGTESRFINESFKMPAILRLGAAAELLGDREEDFSLTALAEAVHPSDGDERINMGLELRWLGMFSIWGGYKFFYDEESYSFGAGWNGNSAVDLPVGVQFAYSDYGRLGDIVRLTLDLSIL